MDKPNFYHHPLKIEHIYIHFPFCIKKCGYCSFHSVEFDTLQKDAFLQVLGEEIDKAHDSYPLLPKTIYLGGGTPSLLQPEEIAALLEDFDLTATEEITLEVNPGTVTQRYAEDLKKTPVDRISLGAQSAMDSELKLLGRIHTVKDTEKALKILKNAGFENISLDLIYGLPRQTLTDVIYSLAWLIKMDPAHISAYCLSLEENCPLAHLRTELPLDDLVAEFYDTAVDYLTEAGYEQYEISNFSKPQHASRHNLSYWSDKFYFGFGPAASGYLPAGRYTNPQDFTAYYENVRKNFREIEPYTQEEHRKEFIFLQLRKASGFSLHEYEHKFHVSFLTDAKVQKYLASGFLEQDGHFVRLAKKAYFISNAIFSELI